MGWSNTRHERVNIRLRPVAERLMLVSFIVIVSLSLLPVFAYANPLYTMRGRIYLVEYGVPLDKPAKLTLSCLAFTIIPPESESYSKTCLSYNCSIGWPLVGWWYSGGPCDLEVETASGQIFTFPAFIPAKLSGGETQFVTEVDIGTGLIHRNHNPRYGIKVLGSYSALFWAALLLTMVVEACVLLMTTKYWLQISGLGVKRVLVAGALPSLVTLPFVWFVLPKVWGVFGASYSFYILAAEALVILVEARIYHRLLAIGSQLALLLSLTTNIASFLVGLLVF